MFLAIGLIGAGVAYLVRDLRRAAAARTWRAAAHEPNVERGRADTG
ncbi:MAG: hypothetical protein AB7R55_22010 [Gemmatimonadales bacterium]